MPPFRMKVHFCSMAILLSLRTFSTVALLLYGGEQRTFSTFNKITHLELPDYVPLRRSINKRVFYTKNTYHPSVKISDWNYNLDSYPFDTDPYCPGSLNYFLSHYKNLGTDEVQSYETTTKNMLEQIYTKDDPQYNVPTRKYMVNYFGYNDTLPCDLINEIPFCPELCAPEYVSTMQDSYSPPYPFAMKGVSIIKPPFLKYRKLGQNPPVLSPYKFHDEENLPHTKRLQEIKMSQSVSYSPITGKYSDGSLALDIPRKCVRLEYDDRDPPQKCLTEYYNSQNVGGNECTC